MSGFKIREWITKENGRIVSHRTMTTCTECGAELKTCEDWSHHRAMHTRITEQDLANCGERVARIDGVLKRYRP